MAKAVAHIITNDQPKNGLLAILGGPRSRRDVARAAVERMVSWHERAQQRRHLAGLDERLLKDIGVSRADVEFELRKPFWRA